MILADAQVEPAMMMQFLLIASMLVNLAGGIVMIIVLLSNKKQRREISFGFTPASKDDFDKHTLWNNAEHEKLWEELRDVERTGVSALDEKVTEMMRQGDESRAKLHSRVDEVLEAVSELRGEVRARR